MFSKDMIQILFFLKERLNLLLQIVFNMSHDVHKVFFVLSCTNHTDEDNQATICDWDFWREIWVGDFSGKDPDWSEPGMWHDCRMMFWRERC